MSRRHEQINHRHKLNEIRNIMNSMKTLAMMETHKLERVIDTQTIMKASIEKIAADFLNFNPYLLPDIETTSNIILLVGSERGFCGDFNEALIKQLETVFPEASQSNTTLISVGHKLHYLVDKRKYNVINIEGASIVEDILSVVESISEIFSSGKNISSLYALHHNSKHNALANERLIPPFKELPLDKAIYTTPPLLYLSPHNFLLELIEHYLFNSLHRILYVSLMVENQRRMVHLENAIQHLDDKTDQLNHKINALRQEEIIEEIEVIILNSANT